MTRDWVFNVGGYPILCTVLPDLSVVCNHTALSHKSARQQRKQLDSEIARLRDEIKRLRVS